MSAEHCKEIKSLTDLEVDAFLNSFDTVLSDCDGVLWVGAHAVEGSPETIQAFRKLGKKVIYVSNNCSRSRNAYLKKITDLGFGGDFQDIFTPAYLCAQYLQQRDFAKTVYVLGQKGIADELDEAEIKHIGLGDDPCQENWWNPDVAEDIAKSLDGNVGCVIASLTPDISYLKLIKAVSYLQNTNVIFLGTNIDSMFQISKGGFAPADGAFVAAVQTAACRTPTILGKPEKYMLEAIKALHPEIKPERTLMIGDRADIDILFGKKCGLKTMMVGTGGHNGAGLTLHEIQTWETSNNDQAKNLVPDFFATNLSDLLPHIKRNI